MDKHDNNDDNQEPIMNFTADPEAVTKLHALTMEMQDLCVAHNIPMVVGFCIDVQDGAHGIVLSSYIDSRKTPAPMNMLGAVEMLKSQDIPEALVATLEARNKGECDCESCRAKRMAKRRADDKRERQDIPQGAKPGVVLH